MKLWGNIMRHAVARLAAALVNVLALVLLVYALLSLLPSDPARVRLGTRYDERTALQLRREFDLDRPLLVRFSSYVGRVAHGDFGRSWRTGESVAEGIGFRGPRTVTLIALSTGFAFVFGLLGVWAATARSRWVRWVDQALYLSSVVPLFVLAGLSVLLGHRILGVSLIAPGLGAAEFGYVLLPAALLAIFPAFTLFRIVHDSLGQALASPPAVAQRALGLPEATIVLRSGLRASALSIIGVGGNLMAYYLTSAFIVEYTFSLGGLGNWAISAARNYDFPVVLAVALVASIAYNLVVFATDLAAPVIDPRIARGVRP